MIEFLGKKLTAGRGGIEARRIWGELCGWAGVVLNLLLCAAKAVAGLTGGSLAVTADALNNLTDAGSSVIGLAGFRLAAKKPDREHPFGHGRTEYVAGFVIALVIVVVGVELGKSSIEKILRPQPVAFTWLAFGVLAAGILVKLYMFVYNRRIGRRIGSPTLCAAAQDSLNDCLSTGAAMLSLVVLRFTGFNADAYAGAAVALYILWSGVSAARETFRPLLGGAPDPELVRETERIVRSYPGIVGIHDLVVHDYGPGRVMISLHAEVPENGTLTECHEIVDRAEQELTEKLGCPAVIHMDPVAHSDPELDRVRAAVADITAGWGDGYTFHDFRMVRGEEQTNILFDVVVPFDGPVSPEEAAQTLSLAVRGVDPRYRAVIRVDRPYL